MKKLVIFCLLNLVLINIYATKRNVPAQYSTIQSALNLSLPGDTILVQPGTYYENIIWPDKNSLKLISAGDTSNTIIDGGMTGRVITISPGIGIDTTTLIQGFKITNGYLNITWSYGGGIYIQGASIKLSQLSITNNHVRSAWHWGFGGGIYLKNSNSIISDVIVHNNNIDSSQWARGAGIYSEDGSPLLINVILKDNKAVADGWSFGGGLYIEDSGTIPAILTNIKIESNYINSTICRGAGIYLDDVDAELNNLLIASNLCGPDGSYYDGGGIYFIGLYFKTININHITITDNRLVNNNQMNGSGIFVNPNVIVTINNSILWNNNSGSEVQGNPAISNSIVRGGFAGTGNLNSAPIFLSSIDYHLATNSPGVATADPAVNLSFDIDNNPRPLPVGTNPDMGCYEIDQTIININEVVFPPNINLYPNPASNKIYISTSLLEIGLAEVFDLTGKKVKEKFIDTNSVEINISELENGFYILRIGEKQFKIVKQ